MTDEKVTKGSQANGGTGSFGSLANVQLTEGSRGAQASGNNTQVPPMPQGEGTVQPPKG